MSQPQKKENPAHQAALVLPPRAQDLITAYRAQTDIGRREEVINGGIKIGDDGLASEVSALVVLLTASSQLGHGYTPEVVELLDDARLVALAGRFALGIDLPPEIEAIGDALKLIDPASVSGVDPILEIPQEKIDDVWHALTEELAERLAAQRNSSDEAITELIAQLPEEAGDALLQDSELTLELEMQRGFMPRRNGREVAGHKPQIITGKVIFREEDLSEIMQQRQQETHAQSLTIQVLGTPGNQEAQRFREEELRLLQDRILGSLKLPAQDDAHIAQAQAVIIDCVSRGLAIRNRYLPLEKRQLTLGPFETVAPLFVSGLREREGILGFVKEVVDNHLDYFTADEQNIGKLSHIAPNFFQVEDLALQLQERVSAVDAMLQQLFSQSDLATSAATLSSEAIRDIDVNLSSQEQQFAIRDRLFANLIARIGLRRGANLIIEPEDVADLQKLWKETSGRESARERIVAQMVSFAESLNIPRHHIQAYTNGAIERIIAYFEHFPHGITRNALREAGSPFVVPEQRLIHKREFSSSDLQHARAAFQRIKARGTDNQLKEKDVNGISALDLYFIYHTLITQRLSFDMQGLQALIPLKTYIDMLDMLQVTQFIEAGSGSEIPEFNGVMKEDIYDVIEQHVLHTLTASTIDLNTYANTIDILPIPVLFKYLELNTMQLSDEQLERLFISVSDTKWISILRTAGVTVQEHQNALEFEVPDNAFAYYIHAMPDDMKERMLEALAEVID